MKKPVSDPNTVFRKAVDLVENKQYLTARKLLLDLHAAYPNEPGILRALGVCCGELGRLDDAITYLGRVVALAPSAPDYFNLGKVYQLAGHFPQSLAAHEAGLKIKPSEVLLQQAHASVLIQLGRFDEAIAGLTHVLKTEPEFVEAHANLGNVLMLAGRHAEAVTHLQRAHQLMPGDGDILCGLLVARRPVCDWTGLDDDNQRLLALVTAGHRVDPFALLTIADDPQLHKKVALTEAKSVGAGRTNTSESFQTGNKRSTATAATGNKIRLAYLSADFCEHPTSYLIAGLLESHDRDRFEIIVVATGRDDGYAARKRILASADHVIDAYGMNTDELVAAVRSRDTGIAIDLMGHTRNSSAAAFARRLAPLQVNYLGYPGTTAIDAMDYIIVDKFIATPNMLKNLTEKTALMPDCYQPNDRQRPRPAQTNPRTAYGLPPTGLVYCCFNGARKISPVIFAAWMRILSATTQSVLWLYVPGPAARTNLQAQAAAHGIAPERLIFAPHADLTTHLARYLVTDLFLDTFPYGAHTTASDALWMGCPVLTLTGESFAARVAGSLLTTVGLPELITTSLADYERLAISLAHEPARLEAYRRHLDEVRLTTPLFDTNRYARNLERAYDEMWQRWQTGKAAKSIDVAALAK